jgi:hypothetical protein
MPTSAASATRARKPFTATKIQNGMRDTSTRGGGTPGSRWRHTAAPKQNALNKTRILRVVIINHSGMTSESSAFAPMPLAGAKRPVPSSVGALSGKDRAVGGELSRAFGAVLDAVLLSLIFVCALGELFAAALQ